MLLDLCRLWMDATTERLGDLRAAHAQGDLARMKQTAHTIKGSAATFGAVRVGEVARSLEYAARDSDAVEQTTAGLEELDRVVQDSVLALREVLEERGIG